MNKFCLLLLSFICMGALSCYADSPCDSEANMPKKLPCASSAGKSVQNYGYDNNKTGSKCNKQFNGRYNNKSVNNPCDKSCNNNFGSECFLCTNKNTDELFKCMNLSETQLCTAMKIQDKYEIEVLSLNEKIQCEEQKISSLKKNCAKNREIRNVNRTIRDLKKKRKEICKCYEKQFEALLSDSQKKAYKKAKKK